MLLSFILLCAQITSVDAAPSAADVDKFMRDHPAAYSRREVWTLDQIRFPVPSDPQALAPLSQDHTMSAVAKRLTSLGIEYQLGVASLDTTTVPVTVLEAINQLPKAEPFILPQPGMITISAITSRATVEMDPAEARQRANAALIQQRTGSIPRKDAQ